MDSRRDERDDVAVSQYEESLKGLSLGSYQEEVARVVDGLVRDAANC